MLPDGYSAIPAGKLAAIVTYLEMTAPAPLRAEQHIAAEFRRVEMPDPDWYRDLYRRVGQDWLWFSRLAMPVPQLSALIRDPAMEIYTLARDGRDEALLELDFRDAGSCELAFFGLTAPFIGAGAGRFLMNRAIERAWVRPIRRFWVHTCTLDHPAALDFYRRSGFTPYRREIEVADDPRLDGSVPHSAAPQIPLIG
jgi:GNAT superfamily N-acetyltransferase